VIRLVLGLGLFAVLAVADFVSCGALTDREPTRRECVGLFVACFLVGFGAVLLIFGLH
jgi:hypothetical protein